MSLPNRHADLGLGLAQIRSLADEASCDPRVLMREARAMRDGRTGGASMAAARARSALAVAGWPWPSAAAPEARP
jgi:hypothetical protein